MKKIYETPQIVSLLAESDNLLAGSVKGTGVGDGIGYGGVDNDGEKDPASRRSNDSVWEDEF
jgi:hypothetical protein